MARGGTQSQKQRRESNRNNEDDDDDDNNMEGGEALGGPIVKGLKDPVKTCQHLFLQSFMSKRLMPLELASNLFDKCNELCGVEDPALFSTFRDNLNETLDTIGLQVKDGKDFESGQNILVLVNTNPDEASKLATEYKPEEIALFRVLISKIMSAPRLSYSIGMTDALRCVSDPSVTPPISKTLAAGLFASFAAKGWLRYHSSKRLTFSNRTLFELSNYLRNTFDVNKNGNNGDEEDDDDGDDDLPAHERSYVECKVCMTLVTSGWACPNETCVVRLHKHCAIGALGARGKCPGQAEGCNEVWTLIDGNFVGLLIGLGPGDQPEDFRAGSEEEDNGEEEGDELASQAQKKKGGRRSSTSQAKGKGKGSRKQKAESDEEEDELEEEDDDEDNDDDENRTGGIKSPIGRRENSSRSSASQAKSKMMVDDEAEGEDDDLYE